MTDGTLRAWGSNGFGQLGDGTNGNLRPTPVQVIPSVFATSAIAAGAAHSLAVRSDGDVKDWGWNLDGQLGDGNRNDSSAPVEVADLWPEKGAVTAIAGALRSLCASSISGNSGVGEKPSSAGASTAWASAGRPFD
jgi:alpha-tubulin suppressor-like RCC1 family protein